METPREETLDEQRERRQFEILDTFDDKTLAEMKSDAQKSIDEHEKEWLAYFGVKEEVDG